MTFLLLATAMLYAADKEWVTGKLLDMHEDMRTHGVAILDHVIMTIQVNGFKYIGACFKTFAKMPRNEFVVGHPLPVWVNDERKKFWIQRPNGAEIGCDIESTTRS